MCYSKGYIELTMDICMLCCKTTCFELETACSTAATTNFTLTIVHHTMLYSHNESRNALEDGE